MRPHSALKTLWLAVGLTFTGCAHVRVVDADAEARTCVVCGNRHATVPKLDDVASDWCKSPARASQCWGHRYGTIGFERDGYVLELDGSSKMGLCCSYQCASPSAPGPAPAQPTQAERERTSRSPAADASATATNK